MYDSPVSDTTSEDDAVAFATKIIETMGSTEALLMAMRLTLMVGQRTSPENPAVVEAAHDAIAAIKRLGTLTGAFVPPT
jgi:hypothetical protein